MLSVYVLAAVAALSSCHTLDLRSLDLPGWDEQCPGVGHPNWDIMTGILDRCVPTGNNTCDCTQEMLNAMIQVPAEMAECTGMRLEDWVQRSQSLLNGWEKRCADIISSSKITTPTITATPTGQACLNSCGKGDACNFAADWLNACVSSASAPGATTVNDEALFSCGCNPRLLIMISSCRFVEHPRCNGTVPDPSLAIDPWMRNCSAASTIFTSIPTTVDCGATSSIQTTSLTPSFQGPDPTGTAGPTETGKQGVAAGMPKASIRLGLGISLIVLIVEL